MEHTGSFLGLLEAAIGIAGFTAIVLVLRPRNEAPSPRTILMVRGALTNAMGAALASLVALGVSAAGVDDSALWRLSSAIFLIPSLLLTLVLAREQSRAARWIASKWVAAAMWSFFGISQLLHLANVVGYPTAPSFGIYYLASVLLLTLAGFQFFIVVLGLLRPAA